MALSFNKAPPAKPPSISEFDKHLVSKPAMGQVSAVKIAGKPKKEQVVSEKSEVIHKGIMAPVDKLCMVRVGGSHTANLGNYESAKISVSIEMPSLKDDLNETYEFCTNWVSEKMAEALDAAKS